MIDFLLHGYGTFDRQKSVGPAEWPHFDLLFVHQGCLKLEFSQLEQAVELEREQGVLIWPHTAFRGGSDGVKTRASVQHFSVKGAVLPVFQDLERLRCGYSLQAGPADAQELARDVRRSLALAHLPQSEEVVEARTLLLALILRLGQYRRFGPPGAMPRIRLGELEHWLRGAIGSGVGVPELAAEYGLSCSRFRALFYEEHGQAAGAFIRAFREREARRLLAETVDPIKIIADRLGYADSVAFHRAFKHRVGMTPAKFRQKFRVYG